MNIFQITPQRRGSVEISNKSAAGSLSTFPTSTNHPPSVSSIQPILSPARINVEPNEGSIVSTTIPADSKPKSILRMATKEITIDVVTIEPNISPSNKKLISRKYTHRLNLTYLILIVLIHIALNKHRNSIFVSQDKRGMKHTVPARSVLKRNSVQELEIATADNPFVLSAPLESRIVPIDKGEMKASNKKKRDSTLLRKHDIVYLGNSFSSSFGPSTLMRALLSPKTNSVKSMHSFSSSSNKVNSVNTSSTEEHSVHRGTLSPLISGLQADPENKIVEHKVETRNVGGACIYLLPAKKCESEITNKDRFS